MASRPANPGPVGRAAHILLRADLHRPALRIAGRDRSPPVVSSALPPRVQGSGLSVEALRPEAAARRPRTPAPLCSSCARIGAFWRCTTHALRLLDSSFLRVFGQAICGPRRGRSERCVIWQVPLLTCLLIPPLSQTCQPLASAAGQDARPGDAASPANSNRALCRSTRPSGRRVTQLAGCTDRKAPQNGQRL
jgi:hypothetical protein